MPQVKTRQSAKSTATATIAFTLDHSSIAEGRNLIRTMLQYENSAKERGIDLSASGSRRLNAVEREFLQAELVADLIKLSADGCHEAALTRFCAKICSQALPSYELLGTYLAAVDLASADERLREVSSPVEAVRRTMISVLGACAELMKRKTVPFEQAA